MSRDLTSGVVTEVTASTLRPCVLAKLFYDSGTIFVWTGVSSITWNGDTYSGLGTLVSIGKVEESQNLKANGITLGLNGVNSANVSLSLNEPYQGRRVELYYAVLDTTWALIADPYLFFAGNMDVMSLSDDPASGLSSFSLTVENDMVRLFRANNRNYTSEDQKARFPGDLGLDFMTTIQDAQIVWKAPSAT